MSKQGRKRGGKAAAKVDLERRLRDMNATLLVSSVRQHEATERAERAAAALRLSDAKLRRLNRELEQRVAQRTAEVTESRHRLRQLLRELGRATRRDRKHIATELHDNLAQLLAVCKMRVSAIEASAPLGSPTAVNALAVKELLGQGLEYTRTMMSDLRPDLLNDFDLPAAVEWVARRMERHGLVVRVEDDGDNKPLDEDLVALLVDCVRELLFNVIKHAQTNAAKIALHRVGNNVSVTVSDAGAGFEPRRRSATPSERGGFGLFSITERIGLLGGRTEVSSGLGRGTHVQLIVPLTPGNPRAEKHRRRAPRRRSKNKK